MDLMIKTEYKALLPPHAEGELQELLESCKADGIRDPIRHNKNGVIVDGMTRFAIATAEGLAYKTELIDVGDESMEVDWILRTQLARRNLTRQQIDHLRGTLYRKRKGRWGGPKGQSDQEKKASCKIYNLPSEPTKTTVSENGQVDPDFKKAQTGGASVSDQIAAETGVSPSKVLKDAEVSELVDSLPSEIREQHLDGSCKLSAKSIRTLAKYEDIGGLARMIRVGQAKDVEAAWLLKTGAPLKVPRKKKLPPVEAAAEEEEEEKPDKTTEEKMRDANKAIDKLCRGLKADLEAGLKSLGQANAWIQHLGRDDTIESALRSGLKTLRSCKGTMVCPKCNGEGCKICLDMGWIDKETQQQISA